MGKAHRASKSDAYFRSLPAKTRPVAEALRKAVLDTAAGVREDLKWGRPWYSVGTDVCFLAAAKDHVSLGFARGAELADPEHRLEGTGKGMRHVKIRNTGQIDAAVGELLREAFALDAG
ncbi:MAG: DUF1801 domain-containing protein [Planctomycetota bacterium]